MIFYEEIFKEFQKQKVKYIIVGGMAFNLLGGSRNTTDLDVIVELADKNLSKIIKILKKKGYRVKIPADPMGIAKKEIRTDWIKNKNMKALNFYKIAGFGEVDLIIGGPILYQQAKTNQKKFKIGSLTLPVISIDDLIKMKKKAGRPIDKLDINNLKLIKKYGG